MEKVALTRLLVQNLDGDHPLRCLVVPGSAKRSKIKLTESEIILKQTNFLVLDRNAGQLKPQV
jgi:hypothetical protein